MALHDSRKAAGESGIWGLSLADKDLASERDGRGIALSKFAHAKSNYPKARDRLLPLLTTGTPPDATSTHINAESI
jgi:hypothetical protein